MSKENNSGEGKSQDASTPDTPTKDSNAEIYENRGTKKIIRVVTVMAYLFSVSFVGILLSAYYLFLWEPPNPRFMQRERLRSDPKMQFLMAPPSEETDLTRKESGFLLQSEVNLVHKPLLGRMTHDTYGGDDSVVDPRDKMNLEKERRLNMILLKLRHSLVDTLRAQNRNLSQEIATSSGFNNSFVGVEKVLNLTIGRVKNTISRHGESRGSMSEEKTSSDNAALPPEFADSVSVLNVESASSTSKFTTIPSRNIPSRNSRGTETSQIRLDRDSVTNAKSIIKEKNHERKLDAVKLYPGLRNATTNSNVTNGSDQRVLGDNNSFKMIQEFLKINRKEPTKQNETDDRRLANNDRGNDPGDVQTSVTLEERVIGSIKNPQKNYSSGNESSKNRIGQITRDTVSIDPSSRDLGFTDDPGFHQTPDDPTVIKSRPRTTRTRNSEGERIRVESAGLSYGAGINTAARNVTV